MEFHVLKSAVARQFEIMQKHQLFRVDDGQEKFKDRLYEIYLSSFPAGTNEIYRERREHDCSCCKNFIRNIGDVVAIIDGKVVSVWDILTPAEPGYQVVADAMSAAVKAATISDIFLHFEKTAGTDKSFEDMMDGGKQRMKTWEHFFVNLKPGNYAKGSDIPSALAVPRDLRNVFLRGLKEITPDAVETVLDLIAQNAVYRAQEHKFVVEGFQKLQRQFMKLKTDHEKELFAWSKIKEVHPAIAKINNSAPGTLLADLSEGLELEQAVRKFETSIMCPTNYKRPTSLVSKTMIENAKKKLEELGLTSALKRRFATINDITINNILYANRDARNVMAGDVFDELATAAGGKATKSLDKVDEVTIEDFIKNILPRAESIEIMMDNSHTGNLVSLIAPEDPTAGNMFKWDNKFSYSYNGGVADSIKERVKKAGGSVSGDFCCRLAWYNFDDLDFHMDEPGGHSINFRTRHSLSPAGGKLDVDMNAGGGQSREAVENIFYSSLKTMKEGVYTLKVNNFSKRESIDVGFDVEVDIMGTVHTFSHPKAVANGAMITVAKFKYSKANGVEILESLPGGSSSKPVRTEWGVQTNTFQKVKVMMMSPNFWDGQDGPHVGNKHYFFMLDNCINDAPARGFLNEFLKDSLTEHRKVLEIVGSKMTVPDSDQQLSGLGFSSTSKNTLLCRVKGSFTRTIKIVF